jgi:2'-5' RNA ligase
MIRLFVGLDLPDDLREQLHRLGGGVPGARWLSPETLHVTVRFIGEIDEDRCDDVHDALSGIRCPAFDLEVAGIGAFENGHRAHSLWAGVEKAPDLLLLHEKVDRALIAIGEPPERRKYTPHITLARVKGAPVHKVQDFIAHNNLFRWGPCRVERFTLFSSELGRSGASYTAEADYPLGL